MANLLNQEQVVFLTATFCPAPDVSTGFPSLFVGRNQNGNELHAEVHKAWEPLVSFLKIPRTLPQAQQWLLNNNHDPAILDEQIRNQRVRMLKPGGTFSDLVEAFSGLCVEVSYDTDTIPGVVRADELERLDLPESIRRYVTESSADLDTVTRISLRGISELIDSGSARIVWVDYGQALAA